MALNLIYDRTEEDVARWMYLSAKLDRLGWSGLEPTEQTEWLTSLKGAYNRSDMNRVGKAVEYLGERYLKLLKNLVDCRNQNGVANDPLFNVPYVAGDVAIEPKTDWVRTDQVWPDQVARYLADLVTLRGLMPVPNGTPQVPPDLDGLTIYEANDIERMLTMLDAEITRVTDLLEKYIRDTAAAWFYSGDLYSKEV